MLGSVLKQLLKKSPKPRTGEGVDWLQNATALHQARRHAEAAEVCRARLAAVPGDVEALQALAAALLAQGLSADGLQCLREAVERAPARADLHANVASVYATCGQIDAALDSYRRALT